MSIAPPPIQQYICGSEAINCGGVLPFSLSFTWRITHGIRTHTCSRSHNGPRSGAIGGYRLIHGRYDLVSIQARLFVHSTVEEAAAARGTKNTSSTWNLGTS